MRIHLCTPYFRSGNAERQAEFDACLKGNVNNPYIDRITLFVDDGHEPPVRHQKLRIVDTSRRLTYRDWLDFALKADEPEISVLSNTDILFDETVALLLKVFKRRNRFVALSRHEKLGEGLARHPDPKWSQDVWAIRTDDNVTAEFRRDVDFMLGVPRCDNKIVYEAAVHGWDVVNPFPAIRAIHFHESQVRDYHKTLDRTLIGGMGFVRAQPDLTGESVVELSVWPLKAKNIASIEVVKTLEAWEKAALDGFNRRGGVVVHDRDWQFPAITEKRAFEILNARQGMIPERDVYMGFPWATLIDRLINRPAETSSLLHWLGKLRQSVVGKRRVATVCQHIHMLRFQRIFVDAGVTDIFWSHKVIGQDTLPEFPNVRLHAFPLYPVQCANEEIIEDKRERSLLFSFVGAKAKDFYLTQSRTYILEELADHPLGRVVGRNDWHYNKIVYSHQILGNAHGAETLVDDAASQEFVQGLCDSIFSLCPSGSGPNSIRLWESIAAGAIPVILADTFELPGDRKLWEQAAVFCDETREAVQALPERLEALAADKEALSRMRHALRQLWALYNPQRFTYDVEHFFASDGDESDAEGVGPLPCSMADLLDVSKRILANNNGAGEEEVFLLSACTTRALLDLDGFARSFSRHETLRKAVDVSAERQSGDESGALWRDAHERVESHLGLSGVRGGKRALNIQLAGRNANRTPLFYPPYYPLFAHKVEFIDNSEYADLLVFAASANIREHYAEALKNKSGAPNDKLVILSEEPLWDTTWGREFDTAHTSIDFWKHKFDYAVLNHLTTDIFKFEKIPYFVTTEDKYATRYAHLFRRNAAMSPQQLLDLWRAAPIRQAYFAEKREGDRYEFKRPEHDLYGYCGYRTRLAGAAKGPGILRVGQGWSETVRRQELPDWHLDKLATLDRRTFICSALENTHLPDYITEKPFDAFAVQAVPVYAASPRHRLTEIVPDGAFINVFDLDADEAAERLAAFEPDIAFAARYLEAQSRLADLFGNVETLRAERRRVVNATVAALEAVQRREFHGRRAADAPYLAAETASAERA